MLASMNSPSLRQSVHGGLLRSRLYELVSHASHQSSSLEPMPNTHITPASPPSLPPLVGSNASPVENRGRPPRSRLAGQSNEATGSP